CRSRGRATTRTPPPPHPPVPPPPATSSSARIVSARPASPPHPEGWFPPHDETPCHRVFTWRRPPLRHSVTEPSSSQVNVRFHDDFTPGVLTPYGLAQPTVNAGEEVLIGPADGGAMTVVHADDTPRGYHHVIVDGLGLGTIAITNDTHIGKPYHDGIKIEGIGLREAEGARRFPTMQLEELLAGVAGTS